MLKITIEATTEKDQELLPLLHAHVCYHLTDEMGIRLRSEGWDGHSGGDDAYFGLLDKVVKVEVIR